ncbi:hypothetical protein JCM11641_005398 [Rhodosporidiobolus odoratus]
MTSVPQRFSRAVFKQPGSQIEIEQLDMKHPGENELLLRVHAAGLNSTDQILRNDLIPGLKFPVAVGQNVVGEIVKMGKRSSGMGSERLKEGMIVSAVTFKGGVGEYAKVHQSCCVELRKGEFSGNGEEAAVWTFDAGRVYGAYDRCVIEYKHMDEHERRMLRDINERLDFKGDGCIVVYGEGGFARLALDVLRKLQQQHSGGMSGLLGGGQQHRIVLVAASERWKAQDYDIDEKNYIVAGRDQLRQELKKIGGAAFVVCVDQPRDGFEELLDATRYGASLSILNPTRDARLEVPLGNVLAKAIRVYGPPILTHKTLKEAVQLCQKHNIRAPIKRYAFDQNQLNEAWQKLEERSQFEAPIIVMQQ